MTEGSNYINGEWMSSSKEEHFFKKRILRKSKGFIKLLNIGELKIPINIEVSYASKKAIEEVKKNGGTIKTIKES